MFGYDKNDKINIDHLVYIAMNTSDKLGWSVSIIHNILNIVVVK